VGFDAAGRSSSRESEAIRASAKSAADPTARRRRVRLLREAQASSQAPSEAVRAQDHHQACDTLFSGRPTSLQKHN